MEGSGAIELMVQLIGVAQEAPGIARETPVREGSAGHEEEGRQGLHMHGSG